MRRHGRNATRSPPWVALVLTVGTGCTMIAGLDGDYFVGDGEGGSGSGSGGAAAGGGTGASTSGGGTGASTSGGGSSASTSGGGSGASTSGGGSGGDPTGDCGNGTVDSGEECDDGGIAPGDGCSASCEVVCSGPKTAKHSVTHHCYLYINDGLVTWDTGRNQCLALGSDWDLAIITSEEERNLVDNTLALPEGTVFANDDPYQYWLGGRDLSQQDVFEWLNGEPWSYAPWDTNPPDPSHGGQDCIRLRAIQGQSNDVFRDAACGLTSSILCELQPAGTSP